MTFFSGCEQTVGKNSETVSLSKARSVDRASDSRGKDPESET